MTCKELDKLDTPERLRELSRCIESFGPDITSWGSPKVVTDYLDQHAARIIMERAFNKKEIEALKKEIEELKGDRQ